MKIPFTLLPKSDAVYLTIEETVGNALRTLRKKGFQAVPLINAQGEYCGTITEGDFLWNLIRDFHMDMDTMRQVKVGSLKLKWNYKPVSINADISELGDVILNQNFVPIVDDRNVFIGIVTRKVIMEELISDRRARRKKEEEKES